MHLWQCDVSEDRSPRRCGVNDIKRPGIQPQPIHMQIASLALTLINSLWVHSFPVNKDLAACEWSSTLSGERQREKELVANLTVKPPQDIKQPPSCRPNPPRRCRTEPVQLRGTRKGDKRKRLSCFLFHLRGRSPPKPHDWTRWMTRDWASQELHVCWTPWMQTGQAATKLCLGLIFNNIQTVYGLSLQYFEWQSMKSSIFCSGAETISFHVYEGCWL